MTGRVEGPDARARPASAHLRSFVLPLILALLAIALTGVRLNNAIPASSWLDAALHPPRSDVAALVAHFSTLPRLVVAALAGAGLAVAGGIVQHVLGNPLASPVTLGVSSGAQLALLGVTLLAPTTLGPFHQSIAFAGGLASMALVFTIAARQRFSSPALILAGLAVGLFCGAVGGALKLVDRENLSAVVLWSAGSLAQNDWTTVRTLVPRLVVLALLTVSLLRALTVMSLRDEGARGLGLSLTLFRVAALAVAVALASSITAAVGVIGFIDIAAPLIARLSGARRIGTRLPMAALIGAALLVIVDQVVQMAEAGLGSFLPTGAATALLTAPLLLALLPRMRRDGGTAPEAWAAPPRAAPSTRLILTDLALVAGVALVVAVGMGRTGLGWVLLSPGNWASLAPWRLPRTVVAFSSGAMLAGAGTLLQRSTGNPLASPEVLGLGAAAMAGFALALMIEPAPSLSFLLGMGVASALVLLALLTGTGLRSHFAPDHMLLTGIALSASLDAVVIAFMAANDGRAALLLGWMSGSTAGATPLTAGIGLASAVLLLPLCLLFARSLDLFSLGTPVATALGVPAGRTRFGILVLAASLTTGAVFTVGPLSFVGLIGPHVASRLGLRRSLAQLPGAVLLGGAIMVAADWLGRVCFAPFELPAGLTASLIGIPYLIWLLSRHPVSG